MISNGLAALILVAGATADGAPAERDMSLNGQWEYRLVEDLSEPAPDDGFRPFQVPGYLNGIDYQRAWFRRSFTVPNSMRKMRVKIHFGGVKYNSSVYVNGKHVGGCFGGYRPFDLDVTDVVRFDGPNQLLVGCHDWTGIFTPGKVDFSDQQQWDRVRGIPSDKILAPIGGLYGLYGIWDDVTLRANPEVYVKDLFIKPSVRRGELVVDYRLANESASDVTVKLRAAVEDGDEDVLDLPSTEVNLPAGESVDVTVRQPWPGPRLWSHVDPYLYHLRSELSTGDVRRTRFGFREFWVEGHHFYLNGTRINLLATSWWPPHEPMPREEIERRWRAIKDCGCVAFRTHTQPWRSIHYDVADELGLLMIVEGAVWNDDYVYRIDDPVFWGNYAAHLEAMVDRDKNRPSVIMWSLENELYGGRLNDESKAKDDLVRMGRLVKQWDPTRPMFYESDGDPGGVADCIGIHYPHEYPDYTCWPNEIYWLNKPHKIGHMFHDGREEFLWQRDKPLYVGEFLWLPSSNPSWHTVFFGDEAYLDYRRYRNMGKAESWKMQILGYRHLDVAGISPWTVIEGGPLDESNFMYQAHKYAYQPLAAFCHDYDGRFYEGDEVTRRVEIFNDLMETSQLELAWTLSIDGQATDSGTESLALDPAEHRMLDLKVHMRLPDTRESGDRVAAQWRLELHRKGEPVFSDTHQYAIFPRPPRLGCDKRIGLYDPKETSRGLFESHGLGTQRVLSLEDLDGDFDVLVVGAGALESEDAGDPLIGRVYPDRESLIDFVTAGGRVLVLEQEAYPEGLFDVARTANDSTMTFPARPGHPALDGIEPHDLKFWRGDHIVSTNELSRPASGGALAIVVAGTAAGIDTAPLLERAVGRGCIVHSQLQLIEKFESEPAAARILDNLLKYLASYESPSGKTGVVAGSDEYRAYLDSLGLEFDDLTGSFNEVDLSDYSLILARGTAANTAKLARYVQEGGNLLVHRTPPEILTQLNSAFEVDLTLQPYSGHVTRAEGNHPLLETVLREDLYWLGQHVGIGWAATPRAADMVDGLFSKTIADKAVRSFEVEDWMLKGSIVERREPGVTFATVGSASAEIDFPETGVYVIGIVARGTPCDGVYPVARVSIDDRLFGTIGVGRDWSTTTTFATVEKGRHQVSVAFVNDGGNGGEDRNLYVDKVLVARDDNPGAVGFLTAPPAVAVVSHGKGKLVVDQVRWDTEQPNARKASRYAGSLLTALGGNFPPRFGTTVQCEQMTPQPGMPHFHNRGTYASIACTGYVTTQVQVAASGRYTMKLVASGTPAGGVYPLVEVRVDDEAVGRIQLTGGSWRPYLIDVDLTEGRHELHLVFTNDSNQNGEDRNLMLDEVTFYRQ